MSPRRRPVRLAVAAGSIVAVLAAVSLSTAVWAQAMQPSVAGHPASGTRAAGAPLAATTSASPCPAPPTTPPTTAPTTAPTTPPTTAVTTAPTATPTLPSTFNINIEPARFAGTFVPNQVSLAPGGTLTVCNDTVMEHSFTSVAIGNDGKPLFNVVIQPGETKTITPVSTLPDGTYNFYCRFHPIMTGTLTIGTGGPVTTVPKFEQPLVQPPRLHGSHLKIVMRKALVRIMPHGPRTPMWTYGGTFPGPTIMRRTGEDTRVTFVNHLPRAAGAMTVHQHGGHQASRYDGQPTRFLIPHGGRYTYDWPLRDHGQPIPASLRWYHDHRMMRTTRNNWMGLQGMFLTTDPHEGKIGLPTGRFDIPLMVTERNFTKDNRLTNPFRHRSMPMRSGSSMAGTATSGPPMGTVGSQVLVNGRFAPYKVVRPGIYRLQLLNTAPFSMYDFALSDGQPFEQIGTGSGLLPHAVTRQDILLGPAQRADVLVDFRHMGGQNVLLQSVPRTDAPPGGNGSHVAVMMQFRVRGSAPDQHVHVPDPLAKIERLTIPKKVAMTWNFGVSRDKHGSFWSINGKRFDPNRVDHKVRLGSVEKWRIHNSSTMTHFVHLHEEEWLTVSRDGKRPPPWERGYEDTWRLDPGETVVVAARFTDFTGDFMIHCHMLDHEDDSMMATWRVVR